MKSIKSSFKNKYKKNPKNLLLIILFIFFGTANAQNKIQRSGDVLAVAVPTISFVTALVLKDTSGIVKCVESFASNLSITYALKYLTTETRPDKSDDHSFPSAHTSVTFTGASFIQRRYGWEYSIPFYFVATYTGFTRYYSKKHYVHDIVAGAAVGIVSSYMFTNKRIKVKTIASNNTYGVSIAYLL